MALAQARARFQTVAKESIKLARLPPTPARKARLAQVEKEKVRLARFIRDNDSHA